MTTKIKSREEIMRRKEIHRTTFPGDVPMFEICDQAAMVEGLERAAIALYDNRLNHRADNPQWNAPQELWLALGKVLYGEVDDGGYPVGKNSLKALKQTENTRATK